MAKQIKDNPNLISRNIVMDKSDVAVLAAFALTSKNISFKKYAEQLLAERATAIRKQQQQ